MQNIILSFKNRIRKENITIPDSKVFVPIIYGVLAIISSVGILNTILPIIKKEHKPALKNLSTNNKIQIKNPFNKLNYDEILIRNIFNIDGALPDTDQKVENSNSICSSEPKKSNLAYKITGIIFGGDAKSSAALLEQNSTKQQITYKLGDTLPEGPKISDISLNKVYLLSKDCPEYLEIDYPTFPQGRRSTQAQKNRNSAAEYSESGFERVGNNTTVTKQWVNDIILNKLSSTLEEARAVPNLVGGQVKGFTLTQIIPGSVYTKMGLKNGDIISSLNGIELNDAARAIQTLNSMRNENKIDLEIIRDGQPVNLKVNVQ